MSYIAKGYLTASKHKSQWLEAQPHSCNSGGGVMIYTPQGSKIDFCCALGANYNGIQNSYSLPTPDEERLAKRLCKITGMRKVKLLKTGSDACSAAVRIARGYKNGDGIGTGYHGWGNTFISAESPGTGCIDEKYLKHPTTENLILCLKSGFFAYCIIEPFELDWSDKRIHQLKEIRRICDDKKIVLIFDEVITFGRVPGYTVANYSGVKPDLIIGAKALGNGYPIAFVSGNGNIMEGSDYFISGTFFGESNSIQEAHKTLDFMTPGKVNNLWEKGLCFQHKLNAINPELQLYGLPTRAIWKGKYTLPFIQEMNRRGYLLHPKVWFLNHEHAAEILNVFLKDAREVLADCEAGRIKLIGKEPQPLFKRVNDE